jgi:hypothetical protein
MAAGIWHLDEGTGATAADSSGHANNGAITDATWVAGRRGAALDFNGTTAKVVVADANSRDLTTAITIAGWIKPAAGLNNSYHLMLTKKHAYRFGLYNNRLIFYFYNYAGVWYYVYGSYRLEDSIWHHIAVTYDTAWPIGAATPATLNYFQDLATVILSKGGAGTFDYGGLREIGNILYDPDEPDANRRWKFVYAGFPGAPYSDTAGLWTALTQVAGEINDLNAARLRPLFSDRFFRGTSGNARWAYWVCYDPNDIHASELYALVLNVREDALGEHQPTAAVQLFLPVPCGAPGVRLDGAEPNDPWPLSPCSDPSDPDYHRLPALGVYLYKFPLAICPGDMNCDGILSAADANAFAAALQNYQAWMLDHPGCSILNGDLNRDNQVNFADINPLIDWLSKHLGETCP